MPCFSKYSLVSIEGARDHGTAYRVGLCSLFLFPRSYGSHVFLCVPTALRSASVATRRGCRGSLLSSTR